MNRKTRILTVLGLTALLVAPMAEAKPPKKPRKPNNKPNQQQQEEPSKQPQGEQGRTEQTPPAGLDAVEAKLWRYQTGEAKSTVQRFSDQADKNAYVAMALGRVLEQEKKYGEAESHLRKATELAPSDPAPFVYLGEVYLRQRKDGEASNAFRKASEAARAKGGAEAAYYLGISQQRLKQYDEAISTLQGARAPEPALIPYQIGVTQAFKESWPAAAEQLSRAIDMDSGLAYAYYYRGLAQEKLNRKDLLINDMERFIALAPDSPEAERARAILRAVKR